MTINTKSLFLTGRTTASVAGFLVTGERKHKDGICIAIRKEIDARSHVGFALKLLRFVLVRHKRYLLPSVQKKAESWKLDYRPRSKLDVVVSNIHTTS